MMKVSAFIVDSMQQRTDSMTVRVGRIKRFENNYIFAQLYSGRIRFDYYGDLHSLPETDREAVRQFILALKPNTTVKVSFVHQKGGIIANPNKIRFQPLLLFAFHVPMSSH